MGERSGSLSVGVSMGDFDFGRTKRRRGGEEEEEGVSSSTSHCGQPTTGAADLI